MTSSISCWLYSCRTQLVLCGVTAVPSHTGRQSSLTCIQTLHDSQTAATADVADSWQGHSQAHASWDDRRGDSAMQCTALPLLELSVNTDQRSACTPQAQQARQDCDSATKGTNRAQLWGYKRRQPTSSSRSSNKGRADGRCTTKHRLCSDCDACLENGSSVVSRHSAGQQLAASGIGSKQASQGQPKTFPADISQGGSSFYQQSSMSDTGHAAHLGVNQALLHSSNRKQAPAPVHSGRGHKLTSSTSGRRKAMLKALVRTTPTRAPSMPPDDDIQSTGSSITVQLGHAHQHQPLCRAVSHSSVSADAKSSQHHQDCDNQSHDIATTTDLLSSSRPSLIRPGIRLNAYADEAFADEAFAEEAIADGCTALPERDVTVGQLHDCWHAQAVAKGHPGSSVGSIETRTVRRSLLLQQDFC